MNAKLKMVLTFSLVLGFTAIAAAQPGPGMRGKMSRADRWDHRGPGFGLQQMFELGMSDKQIQKVMKIFDSHMEDAIPKQRERYELRKELRDLQADPKVNEARINQISARFEEMRTAREAEVKKMQDEVWNVLTPDQQKQLGQEALFPRLGKGLHGFGFGDPGFGPGFGPGAPGDGPGPMGNPDAPGLGTQQP
jgi:protein CpxP